MRKIIFTVDFATKKKGDSISCDGQTASQLVRVDKVAKYADADVKAKDAETDEDKQGIMGKIFGKK